MISAEDAAGEILRRKLLRASLAEWCIANGYTPARHHLLLIEKLEALARGDIPRLAVFMPPGSAKSTYASVLFPPWAMSHFPKAQFLAASHTTELAERWGRRVRSLIAENSSILGITPDDQNQAAGRWAVKEGGEYLAAGARIGIAGFRALFGVIDDPLRSREDADSETIRERLWEWYLYDFRPRLIPGARQLLIQTRWHEDDLAGRCLNHQPWEVISLPAEAKANDQLGRAPGEFLWGDDAYGYGEQLRELKETTPPRVWSALYQQAPAPDEGDFFKTQWFKPLDIAPSHTLMRCYGASDYAVTNEGGDFTVHVVLGVDHLNNLYLLDVWRGQKTTDVWIEAFCDLVEKYKPLAWAEETGQIKASVGPFLERRMRERRVWVNREQFPTRGDKAVRARSIQGRLALDGIFYPKNAPWAADFFAEILNLWVGKHDDQGDALGLVGQLLDKMVKGRVGAAPIVKLPDDGYRAVKRNNNVDAMTL
ncbi:putative phage terminase large subunit-like protein [Bradyrhizobium japonicum]|uniref:phage terminase large subunit n=1 Tax=Bradyrhizobium TaxID=374 RepID=UPI0004275A21|nr:MULTISPECIES: phage terminase large subunit [Bradyrhizobium]MBR0882468.1 phage terminase large subunit [Bradyrhizobium liaoningense]MBR1002287.1 phage terminase large subunit [Bradyrhizobium liaoningense]MBR1068601.1 phage terminase large subunit [Bradyrhizobium liaoningense]MCP1740871.1 putative phage terminase large subunit-like protein [Bradyrhizobium japonicum]MCP1858540.1 putative phage terminase large subunit-like protein [Bradyrhizobium japonicum]